MANATLPPLVKCPAGGKVSREVARFPPTARVGLIALSLLLVTLLAMAGSLSPHPAGFGTHEQLGLQPCFTLRLWGIRCPTCGMTTAWAHAVRGQLSEAARANLGGTITCLLATITAPWAGMCGLRGKWCGWKPKEGVLLTLAGTLILIILLDCLIRNILFGGI